MKTIHGKKALITGAASGIGRAIACALARERAQLCLLDVDEVGLARLATELRLDGADVLAWHCDLADRHDLDMCLQDLLLQWGGVDIVINNAGRAFHGPVTSMSDEQWESLVAVNLLAPSHIIRRLLPTMKERGEAHIVNIASIAGLIGFKRVSAYCLTKFGLVGFSEALRSELGKHGVGVTVVCPGFVRTALFQTTMTSGASKGVRDPKRSLSTTPEAVARCVVKAIRKNRPLVVPTLMAKTLWLVKRISPTLLPAITGGFRLRRPERSPHCHIQPEAVAEVPRRAAA